MLFSNAAFSLAVILLTTVNVPSHANNDTENTSNVTINASNTTTPEPEPEPEPTTNTSNTSNMSTPAPETADVNTSANTSADTNGTTGVNTSAGTAATVNVSTSDNTSADTNATHGTHGSTSSTSTNSPTTAASTTSVAASSTTSASTTSAAPSSTTSSSTQATSTDPATMTSTTTGVSTSASSTTSNVPSSTPLVSNSSNITKITGYLTADITLLPGETLEDFVKDVEVIRGFRTGISTKVGVSFNHVIVDLSIVEGSASSDVRRLSDGKVKANYTITIPGSEAALVDTVKSALSDPSAPEELSRAIVDAVQTNTGKSIGIVVTEVSKPTVSSSGGSTAAPQDYEGSVVSGAMQASYLMTLWVVAAVLAQSEFNICSL